MLRTRFLAAATAAVLMLGMSVGGAGAAFADDAPTVETPTGETPVVEEAVVEEAPVEEAVVEDAPVTEQSRAVAPAAPLTSAARPDDAGEGGSGGGGPADSPCQFEDGFVDDGVNGEKYNIGDEPGDVDSTGTLNFDWGTLEWVADELTVTVFEGWTIDICIKGGSQEPNTVVRGLTGPDEYVYPRVQNISHFMWANPSFTGPLAEAVVTVDPRDCFVDTALVIDTEESSNVTWGDPVIDEEEGTITIVATAINGALFEDGLEGVSDDRTTRTFVEHYEEAGGEDCVAPAIGVTADSSPVTCDADGWFRFGPGEGVSDEDAALLDWTVSPDAFSDNDETGVEHPVSGPAKITVVVSLSESAEGDYALVDESGEGFVDPETGDITFSFQFTTPRGCELGAVVVPEVTSVDECVDEQEFDLAAAAGGIATFTVTASLNVSYTYTVNGGSPIDVVFPVDEETVTIVVTPGDLVVVTATAAEGFTLPEGYEPWSKEFINSAFCPDTFPTTDAAASFTLPDCLGNPGRVTLTNGLGVIWTLDGDVVAGNSSYEVTPGSEVELSAGLEGPSDEFPGGFGWNDLEQQTEWTQAFPAAADDCLPTLAFTGAGAFTNWLGVAAVLMMVAGMGFVVRRNRIEV